LIENSSKNENQRLKDVEILFADSIKAVQICKKLGMPSNAEIRTSSPALLMSSEKNVVKIDAHISSNIMTSYYAEYVEWVKSVYFDLSRSAEFSDIAILVAQRLSVLQTFLYRTMLLREEDFKKSVALVSVKSKDDWTAQVLNMPFTPMMSTFSNVTLVEIDAKQIFSGETVRQRTPSLLVRLAYRDWTAIFFRLVLLFWRFMAFFPSKGCVLLLRDCELVKEIALEFARAGYRLIKLRKPENNSFAQTMTPLQETKLRGILKPKISSVVAPQLVELVLNHFTNVINDDVRKYHQSYSDWRGYSEFFGKKKLTMLLNSNLMGPSDLALRRVLKNRGVKIFGCQHGVSREISTVVDTDEIFYETLTADIMYTFSDESAMITNNSSLSVGSAFAVGMPRSHYRLSLTHANNHSVKKIWFLSTLLYAGNVQAMNRGATDIDLASYEIRLINELLAKIPHEVIYKTYPAVRYADPDPVVEAANSCPNVQVFEDLLDFRYLAANSRILVVSRTSSTFGWCMTCGVPVVYLEFPGQPLAKGLYEQFEAGIFVFDCATDKGVADALSFLSKPLREIEILWAQKTVARKELMSRFFDSGFGQAGDTARRIALCAE